MSDISATRITSDCCSLCGVPVRVILVAYVLAGSRSARRRRINKYTRRRRNEMI